MRAATSSARTRPAASAMATDSGRQGRKHAARCARDGFVDSDHRETLRPNISSRLVRAALARRSAESAREGCASVPRDSRKGRLHRHGSRFRPFGGAQALGEHEFAQGGFALAADGGGGAGRGGLVDQHARRSSSATRRFVFGLLLRRRFGGGGGREGARSCRPISSADGWIR